jgi:HEAT repeat protein
MSLFGPPNVEKMKAKRDVEGLIKALGYRKDKGVCKAAAGALVEIGTPAVAPLVAALKDSDTHVQWQAARALGQIGDARAIEPLIAALEDVEIDWTVCRTAAEALGQVGDARAVKPLIAVLERDFYAPEAEKDALGHIGDSYVRGVLSNVLTDSRCERGKTLAGALVKIGTRNVEPLIVALKDCAWTGRRVVAEALGQVGDARAVEPLIAALTDSDSGVRLAAAEALAKIGAQLGDAALRARAVEPLIAVLEGSCKIARWAAEDAMGEMLGTRAGVRLTAAVTDSNKGVGEKAASVLGQIGDARAVEPLVAALKDSDRGVRDAAAGALVSIGPPAVEPLIAALRDSKNDADVRGRAAEALGQIGDAHSVDPLIAALKDSTDYVRKAAASALDKMGWRPGQMEKASATEGAAQQSQTQEGAAHISIEDLIHVLKSGEASVAVPAGSELAGLAKARGDAVIEPLLTAIGDAGMLTRYRLLKLRGEWRDDPDAGLLVLELTNRVLTQRGLL